MDPYTVSLLLGGVGLSAMALSGIGRHGAHSGHGHSSHGHAVGHASGHSVGHASGHVAGHGSGHAAAHASGHDGAHASDHAAGHAHGPTHGANAHGHAHSVRDSASNAAWALMSPRVLFSVLLGIGTTGLLMRPVFGGPLLLAAALVGGVLFERLVVTPVWNFTLRFASKPALTLESYTTRELAARGNGYLPGTRQIERDPAPDHGDDDLQQSDQRRPRHYRPDGGRGRKRNAASDQGAGTGERNRVGG